MHAHVQSPRKYPKSLNKHTLAVFCVVCVCVCVLLLVMYVNSHVCLHACMPVSMYACVHVCMYAWNAAEAFENVNAANLPGVMWYLEHEAPAYYYFW